LAVQFVGPPLAVSRGRKENTEQLLNYLENAFAVQIVKLCPQSVEVEK
jgi:hypothetical protein